MQLRRPLSVLLFGSTLSAVAACNAIVGFGDFEKVTDEKAPSPEKDASVRDVGTKDVEPAPVVEAGPDAPEVASTTCPAPPPVVYPPWKYPLDRPMPCTSADITTFLGNESQTFEAQKLAMENRNPACAACVFTKETDANWGPIVQTNDGRVFVAFGHCYTYVGAPDACGESAHELEWCLQKTCNVCKDGQNIGDCRAVEREKSCKRGLDRTLAACSGSGQIINNTCAASGNVVAAMCGGS